jgi:hypothetical protein
MASFLDRSLPAGDRRSQIRLFDSIERTIRMNRLDDVNRVFTTSTHPMSREEKASPSDRGLGTLLREPFFLCRLLFGAIFLAASVDKILQPAPFAQVIYNYQLLPDSTINLVAILLPWIEAVLGILILGGLCLPGALSLANLLLITFSSTLVYNLIRGFDVHCGCFSVSVATHTSVWIYVLRDIAFLSLGAYLLFREFFKPVASRTSQGAHDEWF